MSLFLAVVLLVTATCLVNPASSVTVATPTATLQQQTFLGDPTCSGTPDIVSEAAYSFCIDGKLIQDEGASYTDSPVVNRYALTSANDVEDRDPRDWQLKGSNDNEATWTVLDTQVDQDPFSGRHMRKEWDLTNTVPYEIIRLEMTKNNGDDLIQLAELELLYDSTNTLTSGGTPTARGQNSGGGEGILQLFDGNVDTKWLDSEPASWAQWKYTGAVFRQYARYSFSSSADCAAGSTTADAKLDIAASTCLYVGGNGVKFVAPVVPTGSGAGLTMRTFSSDRCISDTDDVLTVDTWFCVGKNGYQAEGSENTIKTYTFSTAQNCLDRVGYLSVTDDNSACHRGLTSTTTYKISLATLPAITSQIQKNTFLGDKKCSGTPDSTEVADFFCEGSTRYQVVGTNIVTFGYNTASNCSAGTDGFTSINQVTTGQCKNLGGKDGDGYSYTLPTGAVPASPQPGSSPQPQPPTGSPQPQPQTSPQPGAPQPSPLSPQPPVSPQPGDDIVGEVAALVPALLLVSAALLL